MQRSLSRIFQKISKDVLQINAFKKAKVLNELLAALNKKFFICKHLPVVSNKKKRKIQNHLEELHKIDQVVKNIPIALPFQKAILTSKFGLRKIHKKREAAQHKGIDLKAERGSPVLSAAEGKVSIAT